MNEQDDCLQSKNYTCFINSHGDYNLENGPQSWPACPKCRAIKKQDLCVKCEKHPAAINFSPSAMDMIHGGVERICRCCYVARIEKALADTIANLSRAKDDLIANPCDSFEPDSL